MNAFEKDGFAVLSGLEHVFKPVRNRLEYLLSQQFPDIPPFSQFEDFSTYLINAYEQEKNKLLAVYTCLDRTLEIIQASIHPDIIDNLTKLGLNPIFSNYPTWRLDVVNNSKHRWFPWHQEKYHDRFSDTGVTLWAPLHKIGPETKASSICVKPGSHKLKKVELGTHKFIITDPRLNDFETVPVFLEFGQCVVFSNYLLHKSGIISDENGIRLSLQFRYDDLNDEEYRRAGWPSNYVITDAVDEDKYGNNTSLSG